MPVPLVTNRFVSGAVVDLNKPPREAYNPRDPKNEFPKMLYHQTEKHPAWLAEHKRITKYNALHPEKPELLPDVPAKTIIVKDAAEQAQKLKQGYGFRAPDLPKQTEEEAVDDSGEVLCSRGCGKEPHPGRCKPAEAVA